MLRASGSAMPTKSPPSRRPSSPTPELRHRIEQLERLLAAARSDRDAALLDLARERELVNALRVSRSSRTEAEVPRYPTAAGLGPVPLRYDLADATNERLKRGLGRFHHLLKRAAEAALGRAPSSDS